MIRAKVTKAEEPWRYRYDVDDMKNVTFERCTLGKYKGKDFMKYEAGVREIRIIESETGGFSHPVVIPTEIEYSENVLTYEEVFMTGARKAKFSIDGGDEFEGYTFNHYWNGFELPYVTKEVLDDIINKFELAKVRYDKANDIFYYMDMDMEEECWLAAGADRDTEDGILHLYTVGDGWCWDEVTEEEDDDEMD